MGKTIESLIQRDFPDMRIDYAFLQKNINECTVENLQKVHIDIEYKI